MVQCVKILGLRELMRPAGVRSVVLHVLMYCRARRRRLKRRQRTVSTNSSMMRGSSVTPSVSSARHTLPALPGEDLSIPLPPDVDVNGGAMTWWNQPKHAALIDWSVDSNR